VNRASRSQFEVISTWAEAVIFLINVSPDLLKGFLVVDLLWEGALGVLLGGGDARVEGSRPVIDLFEILLILSEGPFGVAIELNVLCHFVVAYAGIIDWHAV